MPLADEFQEILDALPSDWTDLELDLRVEEERYIDAATLVVQVNAQPYSNHDWHWRLLVAHQFGHAAAAPRRSTARCGCSTRRASPASWSCATTAPAASRRPRCGAPRVGAPGVPPPPAAVVPPWPVLALFDDLLLGSNVLGMLRAAGHEARLTGNAGRPTPTAPRC